MRFVYLFALSSATSLIFGRLVLSYMVSNRVFFNRLMLLSGIIAGMILFAFYKHVSWWEVSLQILTILLAALIGSMIGSSETRSFAEDYDEPIDRQTVYFSKLFVDQGCVIKNEPYLKRIVDLVVSIVGLLLLSPLYLLLSLIIWFENPGPILFAKHSVGKGGQVFKEYKFRTMAVGSALGLIEDKVRDDRLLKVGIILRKSHIDELPQFFNILKGEMSLVGPRPLRTIDERKDIKVANNFMLRHSVLPGIAGLAQIKSGYHTDAKTRIKYDLEYINKRSIILDFSILLHSIVGTVGQTNESGYRKQASSKS